MLSAPLMKVGNITFNNAPIKIPVEIANTVYNGTPFFITLVNILGN